MVSKGKKAGWGLGIADWGLRIADWGYYAWKGVQTSGPKQEAGLGKRCGEGLIVLDFKGITAGQHQ